MKKLMYLILLLSTQVFASNVVTLSLSDVKGTDGFVTDGLNQKLITVSKPATVKMTVNTYELDPIKQLTIPSGVTLQPVDANTKPVFTSSVPIRVYIQNASNVRFSDIIFKNITVHVKDSNNISLLRNRFYDGLEYNNTYNYDSQQISIVNTLTFNVSDNLLLRYGVKGRGITVNCSFGGEIRDNVITGYYVTGVNISSMTENCNIDDQRGVNVVSNHLLRDNSDTVLEDHGVYIQTAKNVTVWKNYISGWSNNPIGSGFSMKVRNSHDIKIIANIFNDSGLVFPTYEYSTDCTPILTNHISRVLISNNIFNLRVMPVNSEHQWGLTGISFYRNSQPQCSSGEVFGHDVENNISIVNNKFTSNSVMYNLHNSDPTKFTIYGNTYN